MKLLFLLLPILVSCLPESPKDTPIPPPPPTLDPLWTQAWHLENTGQSSFSDGRAVKGEDHKILGAHLLGYTGKNIRIAVSDDAVEVDHPDLEQNQLVGEHRDYRLPLPDVNGLPTPDSEENAHGTAVTGLIAAVKGNTIGSFGVAPDALFAGFNFLSPNVNTGELHIRLHQQEGDFQIFNYSYGVAAHSFGRSFDPCVELQLRGGVIDRGSIYVKASGNDFFHPLGVWGNTNFDSENTLPYYILVAAINSRGVKASYSTPGSGIWISGAAGENGTSSPAMVTTDLTGCSQGYANRESGKTAFDKGLLELNPHCDYTNVMNGTSSATPVISGIIALMLEANPNLTWRDVKHILAKTADRIDYHEHNNVLHHPHPSFVLPAHTYDVKWTKNGKGNYFSNWYGFGRANALKAVLMATTYDFPLGPYIEGPYIPSAEINKPIPNGSEAGVSSSISVDATSFSPEDPISSIESVQVEVTVFQNDESEYSLPGELGVELTSPTGTKSRLLLINSNAFDNEYDKDDPKERKIQLLSNAFYEESPVGESPVGEWTIKVIDGFPNTAGFLRGWSIKFNGH